MWIIILTIIQCSYHLIFKETFNESHKIFWFPFILMSSEFHINDLSWISWKRPLHKTPLDFWLIIDYYIAFSDRVNVILSENSCFLRKTRSFSFKSRYFTKKAAFLFNKRVPKEFQGLLLEIWGKIYIIIGFSP